MSAEDIPSDAEFFSLEGERNARISKVYDGDTVHAIFKVGNSYCKFKVRLSGIDTPEIKTKDADEKKRALEARDWLHTKVFGKIVTLKCKEFDKYGRLLADIICDGTCLNQKMIDLNLGYAYDGGTKKK